jgi:AcrR family transcriptional regulator
MTQTRRRGEELEVALLDAAWDELQEVGYANMRMEGVAERAGTSRAVIYRRWTGRADLVVATLRAHRPMLSAEPPDTGSLREDVLTVLRRMSVGLEETGAETVYGLLGDYLADADLFFRLQGQILGIGSGVMTAILERAAARGEAPAEVSRRIATLPTDLYRHELLLTRTPPPDETILSIVDEIFLPLVRGADAPTVGRADSRTVRPAKRGTARRR